MSIRTVHALLILRGITGRPGIAKAKWLRLQSMRVVAEGSGVVFDRMRENIYELLTGSGRWRDEWKNNDEKKGLTSDKN